MALAEEHLRRHKWDSHSRAMQVWASMLPAFRGGTPPDPPEPPDDED